MAFFHIHFHQPLFLVALAIVLISLGIATVLTARQRIQQLRATGPTFAQHSFTHSAVALCTVPIALTTYAFLISRYTMSTLIAFGVISFVAGLFYVSLIDLDTHLLPWRDTWIITFVPIITFSIDAIMDGRASVIFTMLLIAVMVWAVFRVVELLTRGAMGGGDVMLAASIGAVLGRFGMSTMLRAFIYSFVIAGVVSMILLLTKRAQRSTNIAFGPYLALGALVVLSTMRTVPQAV